MPGHDSRLRGPLPTTFAPLPPTTWASLDGDDLRVLRVSKHVSAAALARHFGCSKSRVSAIENKARLSTALAAKYMGALDAAERDL